MENEAKGLATPVWVPDPDEIWVEATLLRYLPEGRAEVQLERSQKVVEVKVGCQRQAVGHAKGEQPLHELSNLPSRDELGDCGADDMCSLQHLHEAAIIHNLQVRFTKRIPYTYTGDICIAINPYEWLDLYGEDMQCLYIQKRWKDLPPHPYALSASAYSEMKELSLSQSILVSGESGAGKTETVKILMNHLANIADRASANGSVVPKVLKSNPLLEAFGNAKTVRNDNSSRFGKFCKLQFSATGHLVGAICETYLLEKSRVVSQAKGERNFHIFYQLLSASQALKEKLYLDVEEPLSYFNYVSRGSFMQIDGLPDSEKFAITLDALATIGLSEQDQHELFSTLAGILYLGQLVFDTATAHGEDSKIISVHSMKMTSNLLRISPDVLEDSICSRKISVGNEVYSKPLTVEQAKGGRDALAKGIYVGLFNNIVDRINASTISPTKQENTIGLLDIFGFESFENNSFEQFCINYANERLQQKFTQDIFKTVLTEYKAEGIPIASISFEDNQPTLDLIEGRMGLLEMLDEEVVRPQGSDYGFLNKILQTHKNSSLLWKERILSSCFGINHYACPVRYDTAGFVEKNRDFVAPDLKAALQSSKSRFVQDLFDGTGTASSQHLKTQGDSGVRRSSSLLGQSVSGLFKEQLSSLMNMIQSTNVKYVRCVKPNNAKSAGLYDRKLVLDQLRCAGVIEAVRIARASFPNRIPIQLFLKRYAFLVLANAECQNEGKRVTVEDILRKSLGWRKQDVEKAFAVGRTKVFVARDTYEHLEKQRLQRLLTVAVRLQAWYRSCYQSRKYQTVRFAVVKIQALKRARQERRKLLAMMRVAYQLQRMFRLYCFRKRLKDRKRFRAASQLAAWWRCLRLRSAFLSIRRSAIVIQSLFRMQRSKIHFLALKNDASLSNQVDRLVQLLQEESAKRSALEMTLQRHSEPQLIDFEYRQTLLQELTNSKCKACHCVAPLDETAIRGVETWLAKLETWQASTLRLEGSVVSVDTLSPQSPREIAAVQPQPPTPYTPLLYIPTGGSPEASTTSASGRRNSVIESPEHCRPTSEVTPKGVPSSAPAIASNPNVADKCEITTLPGSHQNSHRDKRELESMVSIISNLQKLTRTLLDENQRLQMENIDLLRKSHTYGIEAPSVTPLNAVASHLDSKQSITIPLATVEETHHDPQLALTIQQSNSRTSCPQVQAVTPAQVPNGNPALSASLCLTSSDLVHGGKGRSPSHPSPLLSDKDTSVGASAEFCSGALKSEGEVDSGWVEMKAIPFTATAEDLVVKGGQFVIPRDAKRLVQDWARGDKERAMKLLKWLECAINGRNFRELDLPRAVLIPELTKETLSGFVQIIVPLLRIKDEANVVVHTRSTGKEMMLKVLMKKSTRRTASSRSSTASNDQRQKGVVVSA